MRKAYVVTEGDYSDYRVRGVFSDEQLAKDAVDAGFGDDYDIYEIRTEAPKKLSLLTISCRVTDKVVWHRVNKDVWEEWESEHHVWKDVGYHSDARVVQDGSYHLLSVEGTDHKKVRHIFGEKKAKLRAKAEGLT